MVCSDGRLTMFEIACSHVHEIAQLIEVLIVLGPCLESNH